MSNAALIAFWVAVAVLWGVDGRRIPYALVRKGRCMQHDEKQRWRFASFA